MPTIKLNPPAAEAPRRDVRVDRIGYVKELQKHFADPLIAQVKAAHEPGTLLAGDAFDARVVATTASEIPAVKWYGLYTKKKLTTAQFLEGLKVSVTDAKRILSEADLAKVMTTVPGNPSLTVTRRKGVEVTLADAVTRIGREINPAPGVTGPAAAQGESPQSSGPAGGEPTQTPSENPDAATAVSRAA